jgi:hypothetical protein
MRIILCIGAFCRIVLIESSFLCHRIQATVGALPDIVEAEDPSFSSPVVLDNDAATDTLRA